ncbi:sulfotransferase family 2 domain-containing protein [Ruegeria sp. HKCCD8929]|uniref:sulfotransferase family 2 domain-containing protein n=1 Tax=Ruegeria sp. HKCCD8929 TaxID=2683006 RepID=UPI0014883F40|nr:sulfotransferase family 2 domain-containing protein [Ruegeria sp. HKCCD8929]
MLVFYKERLALLSVPKTGSTAYQTALRDRADLVVSGPPDLKHAPVRRYDRFFQNIFRKMFDTEMEIMAVVREPIDWLGSWYRYRHRPALTGSPTSTEGISFDEFVEAYMKGTRPAFADVGSQSQFFITRSNGVGATHIFKYEHQDKIIAFLENRLGTKIILNRENASPEIPLSLSSKVEERFRRKFAGEFDLHKSAR